MKKYIPLLLFFLLSANLSLVAQEKTYDFENMSRKEILAISYDEMLEMPFEALKEMAEAIGISADELLNLALNREVSSASKKGESVFESPLSTTVITKEEIKLTGATTYEELFRLVPGMIVRQESNGNYDIHIRGNDNLPPGNFSHFSENMMTLVMVDGRIVYNYINGGTIWESLPVAMSDIERIEIIRGASSALYGPNAVSGVINIITRTPDKEGAQVHGDVKVGNNDTYIGNFSLLNKLSEDFGFKVSGAYDFRDRFQDDFYEYASGTYVPADSLTSMFGNQLHASSPDAELAKKAFNANAGLFYEPSNDVSMSLNGGWQSSESQSMFFENLATPFGIRESETGYVDYKASVYGFQAQVNYLTGRQNLHKKMIKPVIEYDMNFLSANLEYDLVLNDLGIGELTVRPGFNYQLANYDDKTYVEKVDTVGDLDRGLLNGEKSLETISGSMRIDYKPISELRLIAALRADKYNVPDDIYMSWQFVGAYNINSKHLLRATYSRANRGSFMGNAYANFQNPLGANYYQFYVGDENLNLLTQDLIEIGYRGILTDYLQVDFEAFRTKTTDFDALFPKVYEIDGGITYDQWFYQNIDMESEQLGATLNVAVQPLDNLIIKVFGTYQNTKLTNVLKDISEFYTINFITGQQSMTPYSELDESSFEDGNNDWTPGFYGGAMINYTPVQKFNINASLYYYDKQTYSRYYFAYPTHKTMEASLDPNVILNAKVAYRISNNASVYLSGQNILDHNKPEIPYNDKVSGLYLIGIDFSF